MTVSTQQCQTNSIDPSNTIDEREREREREREILV